MATEKILNTRIALKIDSLENWNKSTLGLKKGELAIATVAATAGTGLTEPVCMIKIGEDGVKTFSQLEWNFYAKASDVLAACKSEEALTAFVNGVLDAEGGVNDRLGILEGDENTAGSVAKVIKDAIDALDLVNTYAAKEHTHIKAEITDFAHTHTKSEITDFAHTHTASEVTDLDNTIKAYDYATKTEAKGYADAKVASVAAGDASVTVAGTTTAPTVAVKLDPSADNAIKLNENGLKVEIGAAPEYTIVKAADSGDYAAVYNLTKDGTIVGASINIPRDMVVKSGSVVGNEIVLVLNDEAATEIKIPVASLIEYVTSGSATGDMVVINVDDDHKVTATITDGTITLAKLTTEVQTAIGKAHSHENASVLAGITATNIVDWNDAVSKEHEHGNKNLLDTYDQTNANIKDAIDKKHSHTFVESELNEIKAGDVAKWNTAIQSVTSVAGSGINATTNGTAVTIDWDSEVTLVFDCGNSGVTA